VGSGDGWVYLDRGKCDRTCTLVEAAVVTMTIGMISSLSYGYKNSIYMGGWDSV